MNNICYCLLFILTYGTPIFLQGQAPVCIENWEGDSYFSEFLYEHPRGSQIYKSTIVKGGDAIEGNASRRISWDLSKGEYFGWGVNLTEGDPDQGFDAANAKFLVFSVELGNGDEFFKVNIKDTNNKQSGVLVEVYLQRTGNTEVIKIPMEKFGRRVNRASLRDVNLSFDETDASMNGNIVIDDFKFIFKEE